VAGDISDYDHVVNVANNAAFLEDKEQYKRVQAILTAALSRSLTAAFTRFRKRGNSALDILAGVHDAISERIITAWAEIPEGVTTLEQAARVKAHVAWVELTDAQEEWNNLEGLVASWFVNDVLDNTGAHAKSDYRPAMFLVSDYSAFTAEQTRPTAAARLGAGLTAGGASLRTIQQIDASEAEFPSVTAAELRNSQRIERERAEAARRELLESKPSRVILDGAGQKQMIAQPV
jgi:hypothetical protein